MIVLISLSIMTILEILLLKAIMTTDVKSPEQSITEDYRNIND